MQEIKQRPSVHVLVCVNEREDRECCAKVSGYEIFRELKDWTRAVGLASSVWVTRTGCLGFCNTVGTTIAIQPHQVWFKEVKKEDVHKVKDFILGLLKTL